MAREDDPLPDADRTGREDMVDRADEDVREEVAQRSAPWRRPPRSYLWQTGSEHRDDSDRKEQLGIASKMSMSRITTESAQPPT